MVKAVASKLPMDPTDAVGSLGSGAVLAVSPVSVRSRADEACDRDRTWLGAALPPLASSEPSLPVKKMGKMDFLFFSLKDLNSQPQLFQLFCHETVLDDQTQRQWVLQTCGW